MVEELGWFDFLIAVNFPYTLDAPLSAFSFEILTQPKGTTSASDIAAISYSTSAYTAVGIRGATNPTPYSFAHILINEILVSYGQEERKVKDAGKCAFLFFYVILFYFCFAIGWSLFPKLLKSSVCAKILFILPHSF